MRTAGVLTATALLLAGCHLAQPAAEPTFSYYHAPGLDWCRVNRVLLLPLDNESTFGRAPEEVRRALAAELQQAGRFEVVPAPPDVWAKLSGEIRYQGRFNEATMIELARCTRSDLIVLGTVSQYSPYRLPRLGLVLQVVSPADAVVVASVDGLWDSTHLDVAGRARAYYRENAPGGFRAPFTETLALESPQYFQRFVCHEAVEALLTVPPPPGSPGAGPGGPANPPAAGASAAAASRPPCGDKAAPGPGVPEPGVKKPDATIPAAAPGGG